MDNNNWISWKMNTSKTWDDIKDVLAMVKIDFIDYDHKILVEYALKLNNLILDLENDYSLELLDEIKVLLNELYDYAVEHFDREELFMEKYDLPNVATHKMEHKRILDMLKRAITDFEMGRITVSQELKFFVMDWLIRHINIVDFNFFDIENWSHNLIRAEDWEAVSEIISLTGVQAIDDQHREITEMSINLFKTVGMMSEEDIKNAFESLRDLVVKHFNYELEFMKRFNILDDNHIELHDYFVKEIEAYAEKIVKTPEEITNLKLWFLAWWINHINVTDYESFNPDLWVTQVIEETDSIDGLVELLRLTGVETIDHDHLEVMKLTFNLNKVIEQNKESPNYKSGILHLLKNIYIVAEAHFKREERIMEMHNFKDYVMHRNEHHTILDKMITMLHNLEEDRLHATKNIKTMLLDWWLHHTNTVDYRTFVINIDESLKEQIRKEELHD